LTILPSRPFSKLQSSNHGLKSFDNPVFVKIQQNISCTCDPVKGIGSPEHFVIRNIIGFFILEWSIIIFILKLRIKSGYSLVQIIYTSLKCIYPLRSMSFFWHKRRFPHKQAEDLPPQSSKRGFPGHIRPCNNTDFIVHIDTVAHTFTLIYQRMSHVNGIKANLPVRYFRKAHSGSSAQQEPNLPKLQITYSLKPDSYCLTGLCFPSSNANTQ